MVRPGCFSSWLSAWPTLLLWLILAAACWASLLFVGRLIWKLCCST